MQNFVKESIKALKESGKDLIKEIEKVSLSDDENTIENVKLLKGYTHQVLWFLLSYVAVEEYILVCNWLCKLKEYLCKILKCIWTQVTGEGKKCCEHLNGTQNKENCICRILCNIICLLIKSIKRLHKHKREIILRKNERKDSKCDCKCCTQDGGTNGICKKCTCVENVQKMEDEYFTVSTKSLDNIRSTILIFYGMEKLIGKCKDKICKGTDNKCTCKDKSDKYAECLSLFSVCFNILVDLSSMKDGTLPIAVTWLSNCLRFVNENDKSSLTLDGNYSCRQSRYSNESNCNKEKVKNVACKYEEMIKEAEKLKDGVTDNINCVEGCNGNTEACTTSTEGSGGSTCSGQPCNCKCEECSCPNNLDTKDGVFNKLCEMMCCNGSGNCTCSSTSGKNCQSIKSFCAEVGKFTDLVKEVVKQNGVTQNGESTPPTTPCTCNNGNCNSCQTRRFIRLVEEYTKQLKEKHECKSENGCECCKEDTENCLKDTNSHCGISNIMKEWFCCKGCRCLVTSGDEKQRKKRNAQTNGVSQSHADKLCKCLVEVFGKVAQGLGICSNGENNQKCPCSCAPTSNSCSCLKKCCDSDKCQCPCKNPCSNSPVTSPIHLSTHYTLHTFTCLSL